MSRLLRGHWLRRLSRSIRCLHLALGHGQHGHLLLLLRLLRLLLLRRLGRLRLRGLGLLLGGLRLLLLLHLLDL